jgi:hypothetical protein
MTPDEESSDGSSIIKIELELSTAVEQFHARKFGGRAYNKAEKMSALKMSNAGRVKKIENSCQNGHEGGGQDVRSRWFGTNVQGG